MAERTARTHVSNILAKLGLTSRTQAALFAVEHGPTGAVSACEPAAAPPPTASAERRRRRRPAGAPAIVFVHGTRLTRAMWTAQQAALPDEFRTIALDLPGHGARARRAVHPGRRRGRRVRGDPRPAPAGGRSSSACRSAGTSRWPSPRASPERVRGLVLSGATAEPVGVRMLPYLALAAVMDRGRGRAARPAQRLVLPLALPGGRSPSRSSRAGSGRRAARPRCGRSPASGSCRGWPPIRARR